MAKLTTEEFLTACRKRSEEEEKKIKTGINVNRIDDNHVSVRLDLDFEDENALAEAYLQAAADRALLLRIMDKGSIE